MNSPSRNQPSGDAGPNSPRSPQALTKAGDWFDARQAGARLPQHVLPDDTEVQLWTQAQEQQP